MLKKTLTILKINKRHWILHSYHGTCLFTGVKVCVAANGPVDELYDLDSYDHF